MIMPDEPTTAVLQGGAFLIEIARDKSLPLQMRRQPVMLARHFPTVEDVSASASSHVSPLFLGNFADLSAVSGRPIQSRSPLQAPRVLRGRQTGSLANAK